MSNTYLGLDIGENSMKAAVVKDGQIVKLCTATLPENLVHDGRVTSADALAQELRIMLHKERIQTKTCALVLPPELAFVRRITVPYMTVEQLKLNLPYEFHDYIQKDKDQYFYDYAVTNIEKDESGQPKNINLIAVSALKEDISTYRMMLHQAGLKLKVAVPAYLTYRNLIADYEGRCTQDHPKEYCIADLGHRAIRVHIYRSGIYETSRIIEYGGAAIDALIADTQAVDPHVAADYKLTNYDGAQEIPTCRELYAKIALEIRRAVNFYGFNTPDSNLMDIYFSGGLAKVSALMDTVRESLELRCHSIKDLLLTSDDNSNFAEECPAAIGAAMETDGGK